ncbi:DUF11 domain-containing protein [Arthrobacter sp. 24S4-2]|uniref:DUF7927 domain-containing protein n=1 Tax=Arthrobacter sp. 24S4-2 TaxID=2575374 RepID=UPI001C30FFAC|nr:DUF11 domain-containing protein [Arthrobacter sp. 24S4-2]
MTRPYPGGFRKSLVTLLAVVGLLTGTLASGIAPAFAAPVSEITGGWAANTPTTVASGDLVTSEWHVNINDNAAAPSNAPVDNVTATLVAQGGVFKTIPDICKTTGVDPPSSISADGKTLVCNLGTQNMGTATVIQAPIQVKGNTGDKVSVTGTIDGKTATTPQLNILNKFGMDMLWGQPSPATTYGAGVVDIDYEWTLNLNTGSPAGPNSVSYDLTIAAANGSTVTVAPDACAPFTTGGADGHPWSGGTHPADQMAPFVQSCTFVPLGGNQFRLTLTGIDYSGAALNPTKDSTNTALAPGTTAVASGSIWVRVATATATGVSLNSSAPTYTAPTGETSVDDASNNKSDKNIYFFGEFANQWNRAFTGSGGVGWDDTYRVAPGTTVMAAPVVGLGVLDKGQDPAAKYGMCTVLDSRYATFTNVSYGGEGVTPAETASVVYEYYVGLDPLVNSNSPLYNPNAFDCGAGGADVGALGWTTVRPADLSTIKAVRAQIPFGALSDTSNSGMFVTQNIKPTTDPNTDVWTFSSYRKGGAWINPQRDSDATQASRVTLTPSARYLYTTGARDILRTVGLTPSVTKSVDRTTVRPGVPAVYTLDYQATGKTATNTTDGFTLVDTLPAGMTYVPGSASPEPVITTGASGNQVLTWTLNGVPVNAPQTLTYQAVPDASVTPGSTLENSVVSSVGGRSSAPSTAQVTVSTNGYTTIGKTADEAFIPNVNGDGKGAGSWTVTLKSFDPVAQAFTDTIDILPYMGDGRGTSYSGSYSLTSVTAPGSTVYYTTADPASLSDDPGAAANGSAGSVTGNTVGWTTTKPANATAVRVIGGALAPGGTQAFTVAIGTDGAKGGDVLVNRADGRDGHTQLIMRTSAPITVANFYSASLKKYVQDKAGTWHDANTVEDYPTYRIGDTVPYRIVVTNTGQGTLTNIVVSDDKFPTEGGFTIPSLAPGASQTHEYTATLANEGPTTRINTASARADTPPDSNIPPPIPPDPGGIEVANYTTAKTSNPASGTAVKAGDTIKYTVTVTQQGTAPANAVFTDALAGVSDDAVYNGDLAADIGTATLTDGVISWSGTVPVGGKATVTYSVKVKDTAKATADGANLLIDNSVSSPGCVVQDGKTPDCTTHHDVGGFTKSKTSNPAPGTAVKPGDKITYTVVASQTGPGAFAGAVITDDLTDVLDDATYNGDATATAGTVSVKGNTLTWTSDLAVGQVVTIKYSVTAKPIAERGNGTIANVLPPTPGGGVCVPAADQNPDCKTSHTLVPREHHSPTLEDRSPTLEDRSPTPERTA